MGLAHLNKLINNKRIVPKENICAGITNSNKLYVKERTETVSVTWSFQRLSINCPYIKMNESVLRIKAVLFCEAQSLPAFKHLPAMEP